MGNDVSQDPTSNTKPIRRTRYDKREVTYSVPQFVPSPDPCAMCNGYLHQGMRCEAMTGWDEGRLCAKCVFSQERRIGGESAFSLAVRDNEIDDGWNEIETSLVEYLRRIMMDYYERSRNEEVTFGKHKGSTYRQVIEDNSGYILWCRSLTRASEGMQRLLNCADMHDRFAR